MYTSICRDFDLSIWATGDNQSNLNKVYQTSVLSDCVLGVTWFKEDVRVCDWKHKSDFIFRVWNQVCGIAKLENDPQRRIQTL